MADLIYESLTQRPEEKDVPRGKDIGECYFKDKWGFTVYPTAYGGEFEQYWQAILNHLPARVQASGYEKSNGQPDAQAQELFHCSDCARNQMSKTPGRRTHSGRQW